MRKRMFISIAAAVCLALAAATFSQPAAQEIHDLASGGNTIKFAVISDTHFYDASLGVTGSAFEAYLAQDRKMLRESSAILKAAVTRILAMKPSFVIVSGDMTKDGERQCHEKFVQTVKKLRSAGIKVYVCPGNHDVNNPHAFSYSGDTVTPVPNISPEQFVSIYGDYGYKQALDRDPASLSYLAEPVKGLWLLSIDSCKYENNIANDTPETSGAIRPETMTWALKKLSDAKSQGKLVIAFMHHGVTEHFTGQSLSFPEYVVDDWASVSRGLADAGVKFIFTGHFHANDITETVRDDNGPTLYDVETGSLVTYPSPIRLVTLRNGQAAIQTDHVAKINYDTGGLAFPEYASNYARQGLLGLALYSLKYQYGFSQAEAQLFAPCVAEAFLAHYAGDESPSSEAQALTYMLLQSGDPKKVFLGQSIGSLWTDLAPLDNNGTLDLN